MDCCRHERAERFRGSDPCCEVRKRAERAPSCCALEAKYKARIARA